MCQETSQSQNVSHTYNGETALLIYILSLVFDLALISLIMHLHKLGVCVFPYLDDWLIKNTTLGGIQGSVHATISV